MQLLPEIQGIHSNMSIELPFYPSQSTYVYLNMIICVYIYICMYRFFMYHYTSIPAPHIPTYRIKNAELDRLKWLPNLPHQGLVKHQELYLRPQGWDCCIHQPDSPGSPPDKPGNEPRFYWSCWKNSRSKHE